MMIDTPNSYKLIKLLLHSTKCFSTLSMAHGQSVVRKLNALYTRRDAVFISKALRKLRLVLILGSVHLNKIDKHCGYVRDRIKRVEKNSFATSLQSFIYKEAYSYNVTLKICSPHKKKG